MRKLISILFLLSYLNSAIGIEIDINACKKHSGKINCECKPEKPKQGCCNDVFRFCKTDNQIISPISSIVPLKFGPIRNSYKDFPGTHVKPELLNYAKLENCFDKGWNGPPNVRLHLFERVLRI
jgi:hypothetical protein